MAGGICRVGDTVTGTCSAPVSGHPRAFTGTWQTGSSVVTCDGLGVVRTGDTGLTNCGHPFIAVGNTGGLSGDGLGIQTIGDSVTLPLGGTGTSITGSGIGILG